VYKFKGADLSGIHYELDEEVTGAIIGAEGGELSGEWKKLKHGKTSHIVWVHNKLRAEHAWKQGK
jgi:hypothetical protein